MKKQHMYLPLWVLVILLAKVYGQATSRQTPWNRSRNFSPDHSPKLSTTTTHAKTASPLTTTLSISSSMPDIRELPAYIREYLQICPSHISCEPTASSDSHCCASCTCNFDCIEHGSCCLPSYRNYSQAKTSAQNSRYDCVRAQHIAQGHSDYNTETGYWMITKCDPDYLDKHDIDQCIKSGSALDLDSAVPVTEPVTHRHFRNKFCAYCNNVDKGSLLINWKLQITSNWNLIFPNTDLLKELNDTRGNVFFIPPKYVSAQHCDVIPDYSIDECNVTGLWETYSADLEEACVSYKNPFNSTYKNFFCYLCNHGDQETLIKQDISCPNREIYTDVKTPRFSAVLGLPTIKEEQNSKYLVCTDSEIEDKYSHVCRSVLCHGEGKLASGECLISHKQEKSCVSVFLKLTPAPWESAISPDSIDHDLLIEAIGGHIDRYNVAGLRGAEVLSRSFIQLFYKTNDSNHLDYVIAYIVKEVEDGRAKGQFLKDIMNSNLYSDSMNSNRYRDYFCVFQTWNRCFAFVFEPALYTIFSSYNTAQIFVPIALNDTEEVVVDTLVSFTKESHPCLQSKIDQLNRLHQCPYVKLSTEDISFWIQNDVLFISGLSDTNPAKILSKWEYEKNNDTISVCLDDYFTIYHTMARRNNMFVGNCVSNPKLLSVIMWVNLIFKVLVNLYV